jgi:hypothetical protein
VHRARGAPSDRPAGGSALKKSQMFSTAVNRRGFSMIYRLTDDEAKELTDEQLQAKLCALLNDMRVKRVKVQEMSLETLEAEVVMHELQRRRGSKEQKDETPMLLNMYPPT